MELHRYSGRNGFKVSIDGAMSIRICEKSVDLSTFYIVWQGSYRSTDIQKRDDIHKTRKASWIVAFRKTICSFYRCKESMRYVMAMCYGYVMALFFILCSNNLLLRIPFFQAYPNILSCMTDRCSTSSKSVSLTHNMTDKSTFRESGHRFALQKCLAGQRVNMQIVKFYLR